MTNDEIDTAGAALIDLLLIGARLYPPLEPAIPTLCKIIVYETHALKLGIANGSIIPDGCGGFIPAHSQSYYDPKTGEFTGRKT
jgi:hypothetical protein